MNNAANTQRDYMIFISHILDVCLKFKEKIAAGSDEAFFQAEDTGHGWHGTREKDWVNSLFCCIYDAVVSGTGRLEISKSNDGDAKNYIEWPKNLQIKEQAIQEDKDSSLAEEKINKALESLQDGFVNADVVNRLKEDSKNFFAARRQILAQKSVFHLKPAEIDQYLDEYYGLLFDLVLFYNAFAQG